jgi:hypothetical protein
MHADHQELLSILQNAYPFHLLSEVEAGEIFKHAAVYQYEVGQTIYTQNQSATRVYVLASGCVKLLKNQHEKKVVVEDVQSGCLFGMEGADNQRRWTDAVADSPVLVLSLNLKHLQVILHEYPVLVDPFEAYYKAQRLALTRSFTWKEVNETFFFADHRHPAVLLWGLVTPGLAWITGVMACLLWLSSTGIGNMAAWYAAGLWTLFAIIWVVLLWIDWGNDYSIITNRRVLFQEKIILLYDSRQEAPMNAVLSVGRDTTQIGRIFQFGELSVRTYTGVILLPAIRSPELVAETISYLQHQHLTSIGRRERVDQMAAALRQQLSGEQPLVAEELKKPQGSNLGFAKFLSNLVMLRFEEDGKITYRTHWLIMLKKLITPTLVLVLLQLILIARLTGLITIADPVSMLIIIGMLDLAGLLWWTYQFFDWRNDYYVLTQDQIMDVSKIPLGTPDKRAAPLRNIQSINFKRNGLLGILFNYGTVYILIGDNQLTFNNVFNPSEVQREIFNRLYAMEYKQKLDEEKAEQLRIREWIEAYNRVLLDMESAQTQPSQDAYETEPATPEEQNGENQGTIALDENKGEH